MPLLELLIHRLTSLSCNKKCQMATSSLVNWITAGNGIYNIVTFKLPREVFVKFVLNYSEDFKTAATLPLIFYRRVKNAVVVHVG